MPRIGAAVAALPCDPRRAEQKPKQAAANADRHRHRSTSSQRRVVPPRHGLASCATGQPSVSPSLPSLHLFPSLSSILSESAFVLCSVSCTEATPPVLHGIAGLESRRRFHSPQPRCQAGTTGAEPRRTSPRSRHSTRHTAVEPRRIETPTSDVARSACTKPCLRRATCQRQARR